MGLNPRRTAFLDVLERMGAKDSVQCSVFSTQGLGDEEQGDVVVKGNNLNQNKVAKAIELSAEKYCSASIMLGNAGVAISHDFEIAEG